MLHDMAPLAFHPLTYLKEGDQVVIGRTDIDSYGVFGQDGAALLGQLTAGSSTDTASAWYAERYGETVDIAAFLETLRELGFLVDEQDETPATAPGAAVTTTGTTVPWQRLGRWMFSPLAWICYGLLIAATVAIWISNPHFMPRRGNIFFSHYLLIVEATAVAGALPLILIHESFHVLAGRRLGLNTKVRLSRRLYFVTFETVMDGLVVVPRRRRYLPILAGMLADILTMCALTMAGWLSQRPDGSLPVAGGVCLALAFTTVPRLLWQFYFFLRTDIYQLVTTMLGCADLHRTASEMLRNWLWARLRRREKMISHPNWHPRDVSVARWYAPLLVMGYALSAGTLILVIIPLIWRLMSTAVTTAVSPAAPLGRFLDAIALLLINISEFAVSGVLAWRRRRRAGNVRLGQGATHHHPSWG